MWVVLDAGGIETRNECLRQLELGTGSRADDQWRATEVAQGTAVEGETSEIHSVVVGTGLVGIGCASRAAIAIALLQAQRGIQCGQCLEGHA